ncbi:uncharacterized protein LOC132599082 [Lycium barbarum]|uniref:uncharacterized protein LOC132599082 n=1 Tax=Lycium barbarum TaxID=112863 RepID=UPI00293F0527|nr:uncharacterized protein LOC132599082 [Lycium barbarum]
MNKMILSIRANSFLIYFLIFVGAEARTLLEKHHGQKLAEYGRQPYITPSPPASSPPHNQEIVGRPHHLLPPAPKHDPTIGQLTSTTQGLKPHKNELYSSELLMTTSHDEVLILLPSYSSEIVGGRHDPIPVGRHDHEHPPSPKPADEEGQIIITTSSNSCHDGNGIGREKQKPPPTPKPSHNDGQTIISSTNTHDDDDDHHSNYGREEQIRPPPTPRPSDEHHQTIISSTSTTHDDDDHHSNYGREGSTPPSPHHDSPINQLSSNYGAAQHLHLQASY